MCTNICMYIYTYNHRCVKSISVYDALRSYIGMLNTHVLLCKIWWPRYMRKALLYLTSTRWHEHLQWICSKWHSRKPPVAPSNSKASCQRPWGKSGCIMAVVKCLAPPLPEARTKVLRATSSRPHWVTEKKSRHNWGICLHSQQEEIVPFATHCPSGNFLAKMQLCWMSLSDFRHAQGLV